MIQIERAPEPEILAKRKELWLNKFLDKRDKKPGERPTPSQYGHEQVRSALRGMSHEKCFYCERKLSRSEQKVEHFLDIADHPEKSFTWTNLYLSCEDCNNAKKGRKDIRLTDILDPCDGVMEPSNHLTFHREVIHPRETTTETKSDLGMKTIEKLKLGRGELEKARVTALQRFGETLERIRKRQLKEGRNQFSETEKTAICLFRSPTHPFSLMFRVYLESLDL